MTTRRLSAQDIINASNFTAQEQARAISALAELGIDGRAIANGQVQVMGTIDLRHKNLFKLPYLAPVKLNGDFFCDHNKLGSLKGAPFYIAGRMSCEHNRLISLEGGPTCVVRDLYCRENPLDNLDHLPVISNGSIVSPFGSFQNTAAVPVNLTPLTKATREEEQRLAALRRQAEKDRDTAQNRANKLSEMRQKAQGQKVRFRP